MRLKPLAYYMALAGGKCSCCYKLDLVKTGDVVVCPTCDGVEQWPKISPRA